MKRKKGIPLDVSQLPTYPPLPEADIIRHSNGKLRGKIVIGEVFAWEPDVPWARQFVIVSRIQKMANDETRIWTWDINYQKECWNDESRFREACYRTHFKPFPPAPPIDSNITE